MTAPPPPTWHVLPHPRGGWCVRRRGARRAVRRAATRRRAWQIARQRWPDARIVLHRGDGTVEGAR